MFGVVGGSHIGHFQRSGGRKPAGRQSLMLNKGHGTWSHSLITLCRQGKGRTASWHGPIPRYHRLVMQPERPQADADADADARPYEENISLGDEFVRKNSRPLQHHSDKDHSLGDSWRLFPSGPIPEPPNISHKNTSMQQPEGGLVWIGEHRLTWNPSCTTRVERRSLSLTWEKKF